ncbi:MAG TPA: ATP-binding protein, partial [Phycisphaerae bacterium]|nr:ATP-binding protein [Phycisphaerae bacterium]HRR87495.1 ATP-binding protein [Phycisphaerae bacterium]
MPRRSTVRHSGRLCGWGKTHAAIALGLAACHAGYRARFATAIDIINN